MALTLTDNQVRRLRMRSQLLLTHGRSSVLEVVREAGGLQAQESKAAALSVRVRSSGLTAADVERARTEERSVVRTWAMRGTLHLVPADDLGWLLPLYEPALVQRNRSWLPTIGVDDRVAERAVRVIRDLLATRGKATRDEIRAELTRKGIPSAGQATIHIVYRAAAQGFVCCSADRGLGTHEFVLIDDWVERGAALPRGEAAAELARRYLGAFGPATPADFAVWSGLAMRDVRAGWDGIAAELRELEASGQPSWLLETRTEWLDAPRTRGPVVRLLPRFDTWLLGYRSRELILGTEHAKRVLPGGGMLHSSVAVDGRLVGTWQLRRSSKAAEVRVEPFEALKPSVVAGIKREAADMGRFFGVPGTFEVDS